VWSNDPTQPQAILTVKADLEVVLDLEPRFVNFGNTPRGLADTRTVKLVGRDASKTKLTSAKFQTLRAGPGRRPTAEPIVVASLGEGAQAGTIDLSLVPDAPLGLFQGKLTLETDHPDFPQILLMVRGYALGSVTVKPQHLTFRNMEGGTEQSHTLTLASVNDKPVEIVKVRSGHPALTTSLSEANGGRMKVTVTCNGNLQRDREMATLVIHTSSPEEQRIDVPVHMFRLRALDPRPVRPPEGRQGSNPTAD
jgi:hypothetical protein